MALLRAQGNDLILLPPSSPDLNPIEIAFPNLRTLLRKAAAPNHHALWRKIGDPFQPQRRPKHVKAARQGCNRKRHALASLMSPPGPGCRFFGMVKSALPVAHIGVRGSLSVACRGRTLRRAQAM